jgi:hypothetical protein
MPPLSEKFPDDDVDLRAVERLFVMRQKRAEKNASRGDLRAEFLAREGGRVYRDDFYICTERRFLGESTITSATGAHPPALRFASPASVAIMKSASPSPIEGDEKSPILM